SIAAEYKDNDTGMHIARMSRYCYIIAKNYGISEKNARILLSASPMHDIGKIGIPDNILEKPGKLNLAEWEIMKTHSQIGKDILGNNANELLKAASVVALEHHEKWDGSGYPSGLLAEKIHIYARIVAISDVFDALTSKRPYKSAWPIAKAVELIQNESGKHFDPKVVDAFYLSLDDILKIRARYTKPQGE
ncbi:MAG: HD domain-containing phosphohydrolase, partial [Acidaminobacteraceae bacterium]